MAAEFVVADDVLDTGMAVVARGNSVLSPCGYNLVVLQLAVIPALFRESRLQKTAAATATEVVGAVGLHVDKILFPDHGFDHKSKIFGDRVAIAFAYDLTGILDGKLDL